MNDINSNYELLIVKEIEDRLTQEEKEELDAWLEKPENSVIYNDLKKLLQSVSDLHKMKRVNKRNAFKKVEAKLFGAFSVNVLKSLQRVAAILFIPLLLSAMWLFYNQDSATEDPGKIAYNTVEVPQSMRSSLELPDGTTVWLNSGSSLTYPVQFGQENRKVELMGEGYFEVKKDKNKPFIVSASDVDIEVLGTTFNCRAYADEKNIETVLVEGKIEITGESESDKLILDPNELVVFTKQSNKFEKIYVDPEKYIAWKSGKLMFRDDPMKNVIEKLGRWYNVDFQVEDKEILSYIYSATFSEESLDQVLKMLSLSAPIDFQIEPRKTQNDNSLSKQIITIRKKKNYPG